METTHHRFVGGDLLEGRVPASELFEGIEGDVIEVRCHRLSMGCLLVLEGEPEDLAWDVVVGFFTCEDVSSVILTREETQGKMLRLRSSRHVPQEHVHRVDVLPLYALPSSRDRYLNIEMSPTRSVSGALNRKEIETVMGTLLVGLISIVYVVYQYLAS